MNPGARRGGAGAGARSAVRPAFQRTARFGRRFQPAARHEPDSDARARQRLCRTMASAGCQCLDVGTLSSSVQSDAARNGSPTTPAGIILCGGRATTASADRAYGRFAGERLEPCGPSRYRLPSGLSGFPMYVNALLEIYVTNILIYNIDLTMRIIFCFTEVSAWLNGVCQRVQLGIARASLILGRPWRATRVARDGPDERDKREAALRKELPNHAASL
jgi:hypothetical protein